MNSRLMSLLAVVMAERGCLSIRLVDSGFDSLLDGLLDCQTAT